MPKHDIQQETRGGYAKATFRVRISTVLLVIALVQLPFAAMWLRPPSLPVHSAHLQHVLVWLFFDASPQLFIVAFLSALITAIIMDIRNRRSGMAQCFAEMGVCFLGWLFIPVY